MPATRVREHKADEDGEAAGTLSKSGPSRITTALSHEEVKATLWLHRTRDSAGFYSTPIYQVKYYLIIS